MNNTLSIEDVQKLSFAGNAETRTKSLAPRLPTMWLHVMIYLLPRG